MPGPLGRGPAARGAETATGRRAVEQPFSQQFQPFLEGLRTGLRPERLEPPLAAAVEAQQMVVPGQGEPREALRRRGLGSRGLAGDAEPESEITEPAPADEGLRRIVVGHDSRHRDVTLIPGQRERIFVLCGHPHRFRSDQGAAVGPLSDQREGTRMPPYDLSLVPRSDRPFEGDPERANLLLFVLGHEANVAIFGSMANEPQGIRGRARRSDGSRSRR